MNLNEDKHLIVSTTSFRVIVLSAVTKNFKYTYVDDYALYKFD